MSTNLPTSIREHLSHPSVRLHHLLWHTIRDSWHSFESDQQLEMETKHRAWVPKIPRFVNVAPSSNHPNGIAINYDAGESFLFMHRQMIKTVNLMLHSLGEPGLVPWSAIPEADDPDYPVPNVSNGSNVNDVKSVAHLQLLQKRAANARNPSILKKIPLRRLGAFLESSIHDFLHQRWAADAGVMAQFPLLSPLNTNPDIPQVFNAIDVDWLNHPYSSHVNPVFWKLHGWIDDCVVMWREAHGLQQINWHDTWVGGSTDHHGGHHEHAVAHADQEMRQVLATISEFEGCHSSFSYVAELGIDLPESPEW